MARLEGSLFARPAPGPAAAMNHRAAVRRLGAALCAGCAIGAAAQTGDLPAPPPPVGTPEPITQAAWLAGCWAAEGAEPGSVEQWMAPAAGTMLGMNRSVRGGRLSQFEFMSIRTIAGGKLAFVALPGGRNETEFALAYATTTANAAELVFESPRTSFPRRVIYRQTGAQRMLGRIEGVANGEARAVDFPFVRAACP